MNANVLACVVTFNPDINRLAQVLGAVEAQCEIAVVDNGSNNRQEIIDLTADIPAASVHELDGNLGLGAAHNWGFRIAQERAKKYLLILDDDSIIDDGMVELLVNAHQSKSEKGVKVSAIGSSYRYGTQSVPSFVRFSPWKLKRVGIECADSDACIASDFLISSGSLISLESESIIGGMDESLFIDHVDTEWFLRARSLGFSCFGSCEAFMSHNLGETSHQLRLAGRERNIPQHQPFRYYYIFRNSVLLYKRNYVPWIWRWNDVQRIGFIVIMFGLLKAPRWENLKMMLIGAWDGLRGITGIRQF